MKGKEASQSRLDYGLIHSSSLLVLAYPPSRFQVVHLSVGSCMFCFLTYRSVYGSLIFGACEKACHRSWSRASLDLHLQADT